MVSIDNISCNCKGWLSAFIYKIDTFLREPLTKKICFGLILVTSFFFIYILNVLHPLFGDDWMYSMLSDEHTKIRNFSDIIVTQYKHYFTWGGRSVVHVIAQAMLLSGSQAADIINSLGYVGLTLVIYFIANRGVNDIKPSLLLGINLLIWFFQPAFGSTMLWITGSANYMWGTLIIISFLFPYISQAYSSIATNSYLKTVLLFLFGIVAGWTNENMSVALIFMLFVFLIYFKQKYKTIPVWAITGLFGAIIGCVMMLAAPGNYVRAGAILQNSEQSKLVLYAGRFIASLAAYYYYVLGATFVFAVIFCIYKAFSKQNEKQKTTLFLSFLFLAGAVVATIAMSAAPIFPGRASYGINTFIFIAVSILFANLNFTKFIQNLSAVALAFALLFFSADYFRAYRALSELDRHTKARLEIIELGKQKGQTDFVFNDRITPDSRFIHYFELSFDTSDWHNRIFSAFYELNSIEIK